MKIRNNLSMWFCKYAIFANVICHTGGAYSYMRQNAVDQYIVNYIKR